MHAVTKTDLILHQEVASNAMRYNKKSEAQGLKSSKRKQQYVTYKPRNEMAKYNVPHNNTSVTRIMDFGVSCREATEHASFTICASSM